MDGVALTAVIFHEKQEDGSQLCGQSASPLTPGAQHCVNNLLQQHIYTEFDLADVARR